jgi:hypothetical protein
LSKLGLVVEDMQAQSALRTLILNMDDYRKIRTDLGKSGGTVEAAFHQREAHDASVAWEGFKGSVSTLAITLGATLLPGLSQIFAQMNTGVEAVTRWAQANPALAHGLMTLVTGFLAGKVALGALQYGFGSILTTLATGRTMFAGAQRRGRPCACVLDAGAVAGRLGPVIVQIASALGTALPLAARAWSRTCSRWDRR